jgi:hypothetical protein
MIYTSIREPYLLRRLALGVLKNGFELGERRPRLGPHVGRCHGARERQGGRGEYGESQYCFAPCCHGGYKPEKATRRTEGGTIYRQGPRTWHRDTPLNHATSAQPSTKHSTYVLDVFQPASGNADSLTL